jgi:HD superfamily phosphohydrolase
MSSDERAVVDHPLFQRLRRIKQTAFLFEVFPGSTHDRFSHSIGVMHMAGLAFDSAADDFVATFGPRALQPDQRDYFRRLVRMSALLHDIGHGPFSHSLEGVTAAGRPIHPLKGALFEESEIPNHWIDEKGVGVKPEWLAEPSHHEEFSIALIAEMVDRDGRLAGLLGQDIASLICEWVVPSEEFKAQNRVGPSGKWNLRPALKALVSGEMDADRMDYLLRDSHYTGVPYGQYDKEMLLGNLLWRPDPNRPQQMAMAVRRKALHAFEDFLMARFHMFLQLYSHKTVVSFDVILENALAELPDFQIQPDLKDYVGWSDDWLLRKILENRSSRWGRHINDRIPLKHLFTVRQEDQKLFQKFIAPFERSRGTTAWFPSLKNKMREDQAAEIPKLWWRHCVAYLTRGERGHYPVYIEDKKQLSKMEDISLLLRSDYVRRFDMIHVYALRDEADRAMSWLHKEKIPEQLLKKPQALIP